MAEKYVRVEQDKDREIEACGRSERLKVGVGLVQEATLSPLWLCSGDGQLDI